MEQQATEKKKYPPTLVQEILHLLIKIAVILAAAAALFTFLFGAIRYNSGNMAPAIRDGDLVFFYRLDKDYTASENLVMKYNGQWQVQRVVAVAGDTVDITEDGLIINGALQQESYVYTDTQRYVSDVTFPLTVGEGQVFVLSDDRENATDSRIFGLVQVKDTYGTVTAVFRRRNL